MNTEQLVFGARHRMCIAADAPAGDAKTAAAQFDAVLMSIGFKLSAAALARLAGLDRGYVIDQAVKVLGWARESVGAHRAHNAYFIDFPANVPDTREFWDRLLREAVMAAVGQDAARVRMVLGAEGRFALDLLSLPGYGTYQHTYAEMVERHRVFEPLLADRMTVVHLGADADTEGRALLVSLCSSQVPLSGDRLDQLRFLARDYPEAVALEVPVRENRAVVNAERARQGLAPLVTTVTDVLRAAAELSGSDVTLATAPKFTSQPRRVRYGLMAALDAVAGQLADIPPRAEMWKRLGERLHPHEFVQFPRAQYVFAVARRETAIRSRMAQFEQLMAAGKPGKAASRLAPGELWRSADRLLRESAEHGSLDEMRIVAALGSAAPDVSARVLLGMRQHLLNRVSVGGPRIFPGRSGRAWVTPDKRPLLDPGLVRDVSGIIDAEMLTRLGGGGTFVFDPAIFGAALPLTGKNQSDGLGVWPRGSVSKLEQGDWLRFYFYWMQKSRRTDYDLSCMFVDESFRTSTYLSYTQLTNGHGEHSGDITNAPAPHGATEFINIHLGSVAKGWTVIPQLYLYNEGGGESFDDLAENFFGYMTRSAEQKGLPFEPRTVRMKTVLAGTHRCVMPVVFFRGEDGAWYAKWLHLGMKTQMSGWGGHRVEENKASTELLARYFMARQYLTVRYLFEAWAKENTVVRADKAGDWRSQAVGPVTYIGAEEPERLPEGSSVITLANLGDLIPA